MLKQRCNASEYWTTRLFVTEPAFDAAICKMAEPAGSVSEARANAIVDQGAIMQAQKTFSALLGAGLLATFKRSVETRDQPRMQATALESDGAKPSVLARRKAEKTVPLVGHVF